jgi:hypothetical protein
MDYSEEHGLSTEREGNGGNRLFLKKSLDGYPKGAHKIGMEYRGN